jgi:putative colanic acid biosynthesis acetyltransferase WcaF
MMSDNSPTRPGAAVSLHHVEGLAGVDPYTRPAFPAGNRLRRALWRAVWAAGFRWVPTPLFGVRAGILRRFGARVGERNYIYPSCTVWAPWLLETEDVVTLGSGVEVYNPSGVRLEHHAIVSQGAFLCGASHRVDDPAFPMVSAPIRVGPYAWVCARAIVLMGVHIGEGAVLGAGAVASRDLEPWTIYAGNPARAVGRRRPTAQPHAQPPTLGLP